MERDNVVEERVKVSVMLNIKKSLLAGIGGYFLFLFILLATKSISVFIQASEELQLEPTDFILPFIGFILLSLIKFLENFKDSEIM
ncbi:MAG: hypothetical protein L3J41_04835 [Melioribacteraceae bacterium]|nr:hypothetical protein [Melioribacteraceae bacterium]